MKQLLEEYKAIFEKYLMQKLTYLNNAEEPVASGIKYALNGGKRLRPILVMLGADFMNQDISVNMDIACGMECIHNYSLVHDDLPCMYKYDYRHGQLSTHKKFGEGMGVLIGDGLLNLAFEFMLPLEKRESNYYKAVGYIARQAGVFGMIGGQCIDIKDLSLRKSTLEEIEKLNELKTSALFKASLIGSCIACGASEKEIADLTEYVNCLGQIFQLVDDILDTTSTMQELGKDIGSDAENNKITYLSLFGYDKVKAKVFLLERKAIDAIKGYGDRASKLIELCEYLSDRRN